MKPCLLHLSMGHEITIHEYVNSIYIFFQCSVRPYVTPYTLFEIMYINIMSLASFFYTEK
jgi:hypothetical protein